MAMTVLVTGGAGFVGLNVVEALLERGDDVVLFDAGELPNGALASYRSRLAIERGSVLDAERLDAVFRTHRIERVIHAAAITSGPEREARDPARIIDVNLCGTINMLEAARAHAVQRVLYVGSGAAYGESLYRLPRLYEESPSIPTTLYSVTKHAAERTCMRLKALWNIDVVCVRLGTVIGPWERDTGVRDNFGTHSQLAAMADAGNTAVLTEREIQRDWIYARDVAAGLAALAHASALHHALYNLSSGEIWPHPIASWCESLRSAYPRFSYRVAQPGEQPNIWYTDKDRGIMDIGRIAQDTGFRIEYPMQRAYADFVKWLRKKNPGSKAGGNRGG
jgi:nucleoside-diphosphate-sugar epimerase